MSTILILVGSITSATRLQKRLEKYGDSRAKVVPTPASLGGSGCSYSVLATLGSERFIRNNSGGITIKGIYIEEISGGEKYYHDISR